MRRLAITAILITTALNKTVAPTFHACPIDVFAVLQLVESSKETTFADPKSRRELSE
jgi:hypothetical protein